MTDYTFFITNVFFSQLSKLGYFPFELKGNSAFEFNEPGLCLTYYMFHAFEMWALIGIT